jgi:prepilin-type N-terminal cleavage/methylation domain-containing protein
MKKSAYTLVELLVVMSIIGLLVAFGVPAFDRYGRISVYNQKKDEIKSVLDQVYLLARNPESIEIVSYKATISGNTVVIKGCKTNGGCDLTGKSVVMQSGQYFQAPPGDVLTCVNSNSNISCQMPATPFSFQDSRANKGAVYVLAANRSFQINITEF